MFLVFQFQNRDISAKLHQARHKYEYIAHEFLASNGGSFFQSTRNKFEVQAREVLKLPISVPTKVDHFSLRAELFFYEGNSSGSTVPGIAVSSGVLPNHLQRSRQ